jgi:hypothetical protein
VALFHVKQPGDATAVIRNSRHIGMEIPDLVFESSRIHRVGSVTCPARSATSGGGVQP